MPGKQEIVVGLRYRGLSYMNKGLRVYEIIVIFDKIISEAMKSDDFVKYLSIAGSICSILGLFIAMSIKLDWIQGISIVISLIGGISLLAFLLWGIDKGYKRLRDKEWLPSVSSLKVLYYFILGLLVVFLAFVFTCMIYSLVNMFLEGVLIIIKEANLG